MVLSADSPRAWIYEMPSLRVVRHPWHPRWHPGIVELVYDERPAQPQAKRRREDCAVAALKRYCGGCGPTRPNFIHPWVLYARAARAKCVQAEGSGEKIDNN
jgi:hypothetical protein